jgi:uncharacterized protein (DUF1697 family)
MASVVFLRAVNVGTANRCRPAAIAKELAKFGVVNIGAVGTFVVRKDAAESTIRAAISRKLSFKCEIMVVSAKEILDLAECDPFARQPSGPDIIRFVNVMHEPLHARVRSGLPPLPINLPSDDNWLLKVIAIRGRFVLGLYRREMKAIGYLGQIEKKFGVPATNRNWNTIEKIMKIIRKNSEDEA